VIPISGWLLVSGSGRVTSFFGLLDVPALPISNSHDTHELLEEAHELLGWAILVLILLHVVGAAKHHLQGHRHLIGRMGPWLYRGR
jgi:cytochrome b561